VQAAQAQGPLNYFKNYFVTGDYVVGGVGLAKTPVTQLANSVPSSISVTGSIALNSVPCTSGPGLFASVVPCTNKGAVPADIIAAFLYWQTIESTSTPYSAYGSFDATFPANPFVGLALGNPQISACAAGGGTSGPSGPYMRVYRADVLKYLPINTTANVRWTANLPQTFTLVSANTGTQFVGATLVVVYRLVTPGNPRIAPLRSVVIYDGAFTGTQTSSLNQTMGGFYQASSDSDATMTHIVGNGQSISNKQEKQTLEVNGAIPQGVPSDPFKGAQGANWDNYTFNYNLAPNASSVVTQVPLTDDCLSWGAIITSTNVQDSDFDGLLDIWETSGLALNPGVRNDGILPSKIVTPTAAATFGTCAPPNAATCLNLPAMGAKPNIPDIFMQIDWMQYTGSAVPDHIHNPQLAALNMVGAAFQAHGINLHFDVGTSSTAPYLYQGQKSPYIIPALYAQGGNVIQESSILCQTTNSKTPACAFPSQSGEYSVLGWKSGLDAIKNGDPDFPIVQPNGQLGLPQLFALNRKDTFHYALFGHGIAATTPLSIEESPGGSACAQNNTCLVGSISGVGDLPGGDLMVTLGLWRSDIAAADQVGTLLEQAGTLMHELGHNLDLHHGGWNNTPVCMADYPSVMNYLYQVAGLTDSAGVEHIDYSYGLELPMSEDFLSSAFPMGLQKYRVRYFAPFNSAIDTTGQASQVYCNGQLLNPGAAQYVRLESPAVSTPDWSNGTLPLGKIITSGLDINYDGIPGETFFDSPDWISLNLQQVSARPNANGLSTNVGISDIGISDIGISDIGISDIGISDIGISDIGISDIGISDIGTAALGQDALGDQDYAAFVLTGSLPPPTALTVAVIPAASNSPTYAGGTGNVLNWTGNTGVASQYNIYRCNATGTCIFALLASVTSTSGTPPVVTPTYTDSVNDSVHAGSSCPAASTCYNTTYNYYVTEVNAVGSLSTETGYSNTVSSEVTHLTVVANSQTLTYGAANPTPTYTVYSNVAAATSLAGVTCAYTPSPSANANGYYDAGNHPITCTGPTVITGTTEGVTYYTATSLSLLYPANLGGTTQGITQGSLTINPLSITVTAVYSTKVYNATLAAGTISSTSSTTAIPTITTNSLVPGDSPAFTESYDNPNVNQTVASHLMTPAGSVNDNNGGKNYAVTFVPSSATSVITPAPLTASISGNPSRSYNGTTAATLTSANFSLSGLQGTADNFTVTQTVGTYNSANVATATTVTATLAATNFTPAGGTLATNYTLPTSASGPGQITAVTLTASIIGTPTKTYDGTTTATLTPANYSLSPLVSPDSFTVTQTVGAYNSPNVVSAPPVTASLTGYITPVGSTLASNYVLPTTGSGPGTILKATANITVTPYNVTYDGNPHTATGTATGVGVTPANLGADLNLGGTTHTNAGTYSTDSWSFTDPTGNYNNVASTTIADIILKATANITVTPYNVTYNGNPQTATGTATGVGSVSLTAELNLSGTTHTNAGTYSADPWTFTDTTGNYNNASGTVNDTINQATPTVSDGGPTPSTPDYGQPVTLTVTVGPLQSGEMPTGTVTFSFTLNSGATTNYICSDGSISPTACTVTLTQSSPYVASVTTSSIPTGAENVMATYSGDPNFQGETATPVSFTVRQASSTIALTKSADPSTYGSPVSLIVNVVDTTGSIGVPTGTVTLSFQLNPSLQGSQVYSICADGSVITTACASTNQITLAANSTNTGATTMVPNIALPAGLASLSYAYPINATYSGDTNFLPSGPFGLSQTVKQLAASVTPNAAGKTYGTADPTLTGTLSGFLPADSVTPTYSRVAGETVASPYQISATLSPASVLSNYNINYGTANFTISQASVTAAIIGAGKTYDTTATDAAASCSLTSGVIPADVGNVGCIANGAMFASPNVGTWGVTAAVGLSGSAGGNYTLSSVTPGSATIIQYPLTVTATGVNKDFDGTTNATVTLSDNRPLSDPTINDSYTSASFVSAGPGTGIAVNVNTISISGMGLGNYSLQNTAATTSANITSVMLSPLHLNGTNYYLGGAAVPTLNGTTLQLTSAQDQTASAWLGTQQSVTSGFTTSFAFQITPVSGTALADGFAFVIQGAPNGAATLGTTGAGMYIGYAGIPNSIAIEFDTYYNSQYDDPAGPHIGIQSNGTGANSPDHTTSANLGGPVQATFADGNVHTATITYDGSSIINVYLDGSPSPVVHATVTGGLNTFLGLNGAPYVGFTAATGGGAEVPDILSWTWN